MLGLLLWVSGCSGEDAPERPVPEEEQHASAVRRERPQPTVDAEGRLLPSDSVVAGLRLPRGLNLLYEREGTHVYETRSDLEAVQYYFGQRLLTGQVDHIGEGAIFRGAVPREARGARIQLDVAAFPVPGGRTRVEVRELPPPAVPLTESQYRQRLMEDMQQWQ